MTTMTEALRLLPDFDTLMRILRACIAPDLCTGSLKMLDRQPDPYSSSSPTEIETCRLDNGVELKLLCKYDSGPKYAVGPRGRMAREVLIYRHVVGPLGLQLHLFGSYTVAETGETWLFLDRAARWHGESVSAWAVKLHWIFSWLGANPEWLHDAKSRRLFGELLVVSRRAGYVD